MLLARVTEPRGLRAVAAEAMGLGVPLGDNCGGSEPDPEIHGSGFNGVRPMRQADTSWVKVSVLIGAGAAVALHVGKVPAALPVLQSELGLSLVQSGWVVAIFSVVAACVAVFLGTVSDRFGHLPLAMVGMVLTALAGVAGALASSGNLLLVTRVFEGFGFILTTTSIPPLIMRAASQSQRQASLALWGMYMPVGSGLMMALSAPLLYYFDWRILWWVASALVLLAALPVYSVGARISDDSSPAAARPAIARTLKTALRRGPLLLSVTFAVYAGNYMVLAGFLPLLLVDLNGFSPMMAATASAIIVLFNALGNGISGWLHNYGLRYSTLIPIGCLGMAVGGGLVFAPELSGLWRMVAAAGFCGFAGLVPSSLFSEAPHRIPHPSFLATVSGLLVQGAAIGQLLMPPLAAAAVAWYGSWSAGITFMVIGSGFIAFCAFVLSRTGDPVHA